MRPCPKPASASITGALLKPCSLLPAAMEPSMPAASPAISTRQEQRCKAAVMPAWLVTMPCVFMPRKKPYCITRMLYAGSLIWDLTINQNSSHRFSWAWQKLSASWGTILRLATFTGKRCLHCQVRSKRWQFFSCSIFNYCKENPFRFMRDWPQNTNTCWWRKAIPGRWLCFTGRRVLLP